MGKMKGLLEKMGEGNCERRLVQENGLLGLSGGRLKMRRNGGTVMAGLAKGEEENQELLRERDGEMAPGECGDLQWRGGFLGSLVMGEQKPRTSGDDDYFKRSPKWAAAAPLA
jgi:hypothetical protein